MTREEAIKILNPQTSRDALWKYEGKEEGIKAVVDASLIAIEDMEKQIPKKPLKEKDEITDLIIHYRCPACGRYFGQRGVHNVILFTKEVYCQNKECGQSIDWSEERG